MNAFPSLTNRKGQANGVFGLMVTATLAIVVVFVALTLSSDVIDNVRDTQAVNGTAYNTSSFALTTFGNLSSQGSNIGLIVGVGFLLLVLVAIFGKIALGMGGNKL